MSQQDYRNELPSDRTARKEKERVEREAAQIEEREKLRRAMAVTFNNADGKIVLSWIRKKCFHDVPALTMSGPPGSAGALEPSPNATLHMAMRQALYLELRKLIPWEITTEVERD